MMNKALLTLLLSLALAAAAEAYRYPNPKQQETACIKTGGSWETLPAYCDNMHPRSWNKMTEDQQKTCRVRFNQPCNCGKGMRFSVVKVLGCVKSNFPQDQ